MTPRHHPSEAVLADYASGAQRPAFAAVTASHLQHCRQCAGRVGLFEAVGGSMLDDLPASEMAADALSSVLARLDTPSPSPPRTSTREPVPSRFRFGRRRWIAPGVWLRQADRGICGQDLLYLLRMPQGMSTIPHSHQGCENTAVLKGAFEDDSGAYRAGDFAEVSEDRHHKPHVTEQDECICLVASEGRMRTQSLMGRVVQALTGV